MPNVSKLYLAAVMLRTSILNEKPFSCVLTKDRTSQKSSLGALWLAGGSVLYGCRVTSEIGG